MMRRWCMTGLGLGYAPVASGTFGSAGASAIALAVWAVVNASGGDGLLLNSVWCGLILLASVGCVHWGAWAVEEFSARAGKTGDPGQVVLDEWAGQWLALLGFAMPDFPRAAAVVFVQFFLFRLFDVIKPPPGRRLERLPLGWGILFDDLAAAVYANVVGQVVFHFFLPV